jgi:hypothetical protein
MKFRNLINDKEFNRKSILISNDETKVRTPLKIAEDMYLDGNLNTEYILYIIRIILKNLTLI